MEASIPAGPDIDDKTLEASLPAGPLQGPRGQVLFNKSPFVIPEDLSPPSPGKFKGGWYKLSETKAENDLRIAKSGAPNVAQAQLVDVIPKTAVDYSELKAGTYNFNTVLPNKSDTIVNKAYKPAIRVEIAIIEYPGWHDLRCLRYR